MVAGTGPRSATYADVEALPDDVVGEVVDGELHVSPRPRPRHSRAAHSLGSALDGPFDRGRGGPGGWFFLVEPELRLDGQLLVPDYAGWRRERWQPVGETAAISVVPDWVCEILSPSTARLDRRDKMDAYARLDVRWIWLVDPLARTVEAYRNLERSWLRLGTWADDARARIEPFDAVELELAGWWLD